MFCVSLVCSFKEICCNDEKNKIMESQQCCLGQCGLNRHMMSKKVIQDRWDIFYHPQSLQRRFFFKYSPFRASFSLFLSFLFNYNWWIKLCRCWDSNCGSLVSKATALPTEPPSLPKKVLFVSSHALTWRGCPSTNLSRLRRKQKDLSQLKPKSSQRWGPTFNYHSSLTNALGLRLRLPATSYF